MSVEQLLRAGLSASTLRTEFEAVGERCAQPAGFLVGGPSLAPQRHPREWLSSLGPGLEEPHSGFRLRKAGAQLFGAACEGASGDGDGGRAGSPPGLGQGLPGPGEVLALSDATAVRGGMTLPQRLSLYRVCSRSGLWRLCGECWLPRSLSHRCSHTRRPLVVAQVPGALRLAV